MRDEDFNACEEQGEEAERGDPVGDADDGCVPGRVWCAWNGRGGARDARGISHADMLPR